MQASDLEHAFPLDISQKIVSSLEVIDLCALGSCSRYCKELCDSDYIWAPITRARWPLLASSSTCFDQKGWKEIYVRTHTKMEIAAKAVTEFVKRCSSSGSLEIEDYYKAIQDLSSMQLSFQDIQMFLFNPKLSVLINLVGLNYCIICLNEPVEVVMEALERSKISGRYVCVNWLTLGRWFFGFQMSDEPHSCWVSLANLLSTELGEELLGVLHRGVIDDVLRVEMSASPTTFDPCSCHGSQNHQH